MKPFLCTDITTNKKNKIKDGQEFACGYPNEAYSSTYEKICHQIDNIQKENGKKIDDMDGDILHFCNSMVWAFLLSDQANRLVV